MGQSLSRPGSHCPVCRHTNPLVRQRADPRVVLAPRTLSRLRHDHLAALPCGRGNHRRSLLGARLARSPVGWGESADPTRAGRPAGVLMLPLAAGELWGLLAYHLLLLSTLLAAAGIEYDGHVTPWRLGMPALALGCAAPVVWPFLHPVPAWSGLLGSPLAGLFDNRRGVDRGHRPGCGSVAGHWASPGAGLPAGFNVRWDISRMAGRPGNRGRRDARACDCHSGRTFVPRPRRRASHNVARDSHLRLFAFVAADHGTSTNCTAHKCRGYTDVDECGCSHDPTGCKRYAWRDSQSPIPNPLASSL